VPGLPQLASLLHSENNLTVVLGQVDRVLGL
jgi:hypothetical protein